MSLPQAGRLHFAGLCTGQFVTVRGTARGSAGATEIEDAAVAPSLIGCRAVVVDPKPRLGGAAAGEADVSDLTRNAVQDVTPAALGSVDGGTMLLADVERVATGAGSGAAEVVDDASDLMGNAMPEAVGGAQPGSGGADVAADSMNEAAAGANGVVEVEICSGPSAGQTVLLPRGALESLRLEPLRPMDAVVVLAPGAHCGKAGLVVDPRSATAVKVKLTREGSEDSLFATFLREGLQKRDDRNSSAEEH